MFAHRVLSSLAVALSLALGACASGDDRVGTLLLDDVPTDDPWASAEGLLEATRLDSGATQGWFFMWEDADTAEIGIAALDASETAAIWLDLPVQMVDPSEPAPSDPLLTVVQVPVPWFATRGLVVDRFRKAVPEYEAVDGLLRKDFLLTEDRQLGGVYRWADPEAADAFFDEAWHLDIEDRYGQPAELLRFEAVDPDW